MSAETESPNTANPQPPHSELTRAIVDIDVHLNQAGWDQPLRLYALVETADLIAHQPHLAEVLGLGLEALPGQLTPIEQEDLPEVELDELLSTIMWPDDVLGVALSQEVLTAPPDAKDDQPEEIRLTVGVLRDGQRACAIRKRGDSDGKRSDVLIGADLVPNLGDALAGTFDS